MAENISKVGVVLDTLGPENTAALRYAILQLNKLQSFAEFEIVYDNSFDPGFLDKCSSNRSYNPDDLVALIGDFDSRIESSIEHGFQNVREGVVCDRYIAICNCKLSNNYYLIGFGKRLSLLFTGAWKHSMAPPSLLEFIIHQCLLLGVRSNFSGHLESHYPSRGCLFDFNMTLENCRNSILMGHICSDCRDLLSENRNLETLTNVLGGRWLGSPEDTTSAYSELERLGHSPFQSSRVKKTWTERIKEIAETKVVEEVVKYAVLACFLYVAIKLGLQPLVDKL